MNWEIKDDDSNVVTFDLNFLDAETIEMIRNMLKNILPEKPEPEVNWGRDGF